MQQERKRTKVLERKLARTQKSLVKAMNKTQMQFKKCVKRAEVQHINKERIASEIENCSSIGISEKKRSPQIIVSLTSYPDRMYDVHYCLHSLLNQSFKPNKVILWLAHEQFPNGESDVPKKVLALKERGLSIEWHHDIKSYKKVIPALKKYPEDIIVTADDDIYYSNDWLEKLISTYNETSDIVCHRAHGIMFDGAEIAPYSKWIKCIQNARASVFNFPTTGGGVLYPPHSLHKDTTNEELFYSLAPHADDLWLWAMVLLADRKVRVVAAKPNSEGVISRELCYINPIRELGIGDESTLFHTNITKNDEQLSKIMQEYPSLLNVLQDNYRPLVSVIIPVYNTSKYLRQCLDSVLSQTLNNIEVICVNDGSTDTSLSILRSYEAADSRVHVIDKPNAGYGHTMNMGIAHATGEYIAFLESDDYITENAYEVLYSTARCYDVDIIKAGYYKVFSDKVEPEAREQQITRNQDLYDKVLDPAIEKGLFYIEMMNCLGLFKRSFIENNSIVHNETPGAAHQDVGFWFQTFIQAKRVYLLEDCFYCYRQDNADSSMNNMVSYDYLAHEWDFVKKIMTDKPELVETFSDIYWIRRFTSSQWVLSVLDDKLKRDFVHVLSAVFGKALETGDFDDSRFLEQHRVHLNGIVEDPEQYYFDFCALPKEVASKKEPRVSVILPVYNNSKHLNKCLDSILGQTLKNIEVLCINDGSTDNSLKILQKYEKSDPRVKVFSQHNAGAAVARNYGIDIARGTYLSILDADDIFDSRMLESAYQSCIQKNADFCTYRSDRFYSDNFRKKLSASYTIRKEQLPELTCFSYKDLTGNVFTVFVGWAWDKMYSTAFVRENNIKFQELKRTNDMLFVYTALVKARKIVIVDSVLAHKRLAEKKQALEKEDAGWDCFYHALLGLRDVLLEMQIFDELHQDYVNYALKHSLWHLSACAEATFDLLYERLRNEWFEEFGVFEHDMSFFYDKNDYQELSKIKDCSLSDYKRKYRTV
jgi:glycosyltransferase involved in cell wall biosynthesis